MNPYESDVSLTMQGHYNTPNTHKYSVILPTYNERKNLPIIIWLLAKVFQEKYVHYLPLSIRSSTVKLYSQLAWEVIVVDDASPDGTQDIARQLASVYGEDKIVSRVLFSIKVSYYEHVYMSLNLAQGSLVWGNSARVFQ